MDGAGGKSFGLAVVAWAFAGSGTAAGGRTLTLSSAAPAPAPAPAPSPAPEGEPEPEPESAPVETSPDWEDALPTTEVGWVVTADTTHTLTAWRADSWAPMFCGSAVSTENALLGRAPIACMAVLGRFGAGDQLTDVDCVLAVDDETPGAVTLWVRPD